MTELLPSILIWRVIFLNEGRSCKTQAHSISFYIGCATIERHEINNEWATKWWWIWLTNGKHLYYRYLTALSICGCVLYFIAMSLFARYIRKNDYQIRTLTSTDLSGLKTGTNLFVTKFCKCTHDIFLSARHIFAVFTAIIAFLLCFFIV